MKRITVSLEDDLYRTVKAHSIHEDISMSKAVVDLLRRAIVEPESCMDAVVAEERFPRFYTDKRTGLRVMSIGRKITVEDVAQAIDDDDLRYLKHFPPTKSKE